MPASAESIDQSNDVSRDHVANIGSWGQSFTPTMKLLTQVDLALNSFHNKNTYTVTLYILQTWNGPILGSATATVPPGIDNHNVGEFTSFVFSPPIELTPGVQYIIRVDLEQYFHQGGTNDMISWFIHDTDSYPGGTAIQNGYARPDEMVFRTWGLPALPVGGVIVDAATPSTYAVEAILLTLIAASMTIALIMLKWGPPLPRFN
jgi:hypothetical protein